MYRIYEFIDWVADLDLWVVLWVRLDIPIVTLEIPGYANERSSDWLWMKYGALLHSFIVYEPTN